jgi:hypothetical protein
MGNIRERYGLLRFIVLHVSGSFEPPVFSGGSLLPKSLSRFSTVSMILRRLSARLTSAFMLEKLYALSFLSVGDIRAS